MSAMGRVLTGRSGWKADVVIRVGGGQNVAMRGSSENFRVRQAQLSDAGAIDRLIIYLDGVRRSLVFGPWVGSRPQSALQLRAA